jgi:hypothetical protein
MKNLDHLFGLPVLLLLELALRNTVLKVLYKIPTPALLEGIGLKLELE